MKTLVISAGELPLPAELEAVIERGSTAIERRHSADIPPTGAMPDADRVVFWSTGRDETLRRLASRLVKAEHRARREVIVFVTTRPEVAVAGLSANELFVWPQDQDRLTMAFMTGA